MYEHGVDLLAEVPPVPVPGAAGVRVKAIAEVVTEHLQRVGRPRTAMACAFARRLPQAESVVEELAPGEPHCVTLPSENRFWRTSLKIRFETLRGDGPPTGCCTPSGMLAGATRR